MEIHPKIKATVEKILSWLPEQPLAYHLTGSYARTMQASRDIDLYLLFPKKHDFFQMLEGERFINGLRMDLFFFVPPTNLLKQYEKMARNEMKEQGWEVSGG